MNDQKIKAFTILEVTITMLIAGLLIGITYTAYSIVIQSYHSFSTKNNDMAVVITLDHLLKRDFERADSIYKDTAGIMMRKDAMTIKYEFGPDFIVRKAARIDTFKVQTEDVNTSFESMSLSELQNSEEQNRIDELGFTLVFKGDKAPYHYLKSYSSENLINRNPHAVN